MKHGYVALVLILTATPCPACGAGRPATSETGRLSAVETPVAIEALLPGVWVHRSVKYLPEFGGDVPSNGLIAKASDGAVVIDTAWTPEQTAEVLDWAQTNVGPVRAVIVTHWHDDRSGGLSEVHRRSIPSYGSSRTDEQASAHGATPPNHLFDETLDLRSLGLDGEAYFPGAGHSLDNVVVWLGGPQLLFGGCLIKAVEAQGMGNTVDGDLDAWPDTLARVERRYPQAKHVVPGHGAPGDRSLILRTHELLGR